MQIGNLIVILCENIIISGIYIKIFTSAQYFPY